SIPINTKAQYNQIWAFGQKAGLNFNTSPPTAIETQISSQEASASICDEMGNLLFYTDGDTLWDKHHKAMPNGLDLSGTGSNITYSSAQGTLIVPAPGKPKKYYVFSLGCTESNFLGHLYYCTVD